VADGLRLPLYFSDGHRRRPLAKLVELVEMEEASDGLKEIYQDIMSFYDTERVPAIFKALPHDEGYLKGHWGAVRFVFQDGQLDRLTKEAIALAAFMAAKSDYGVDLHLSGAMARSTDRTMLIVYLGRLLFACWSPG
jgi:alkylhydroperoxidase/carboxymuconolactone decarboxylase family protein YurZ